MTEMNEGVRAQLQEARAEAQAETKDVRAEVAKRNSELDSRIEVLEREGVDLRNENGYLKAFMKKGMALGNKVKKRVALNAARAAAEKTVGKTKAEAVTWHVYFRDFSGADWERAGVSKREVQALLVDGAVEFNESIHNVPAQEVVGGIVAMRPGPTRSAWEDIFLLAFKRKVSDEVFRDELDYAEDQARLFGEF